MDQNSNHYNVFDATQNLDVRLQSLAVYVVTNGLVDITKVTTHSEQILTLFREYKTRIRIGSLTLANIEEDVSLKYGAYSPDVREQAYKEYEQWASKIAAEIRPNLGNDKKKE